MDVFSKQKINKWTGASHGTLDQMDLIGTFDIFILKPIIIIFAGIMQSLNDTIDLMD